MEEHPSTFCSDPFKMWAYCCKGLQGLWLMLLGMPATCTAGESIECRNECQFVQAKKYPQPADKATSPEVVTRGCVSRYLGRMTWSDPSLPAVQ